MRRSLPATHPEPSFVPLRVSGAGAVHTSEGLGHRHPSIAKVTVPPRPRKKSSPWRPSSPILGSSARDRTGKSVRSHAKAHNPAQRDARQDPFRFELRFESGSGEDIVHACIFLRNQCYPKTVRPKNGASDLWLIDIGWPSRAFPVTPPYKRITHTAVPRACWVAPSWTFGGLRADAVSPLNEDGLSRFAGAISSSHDGPTHPLHGSGLRVQTCGSASLCPRLSALGCPTRLAYSYLLCPLLTSARRWARIAPRSVYPTGRHRADLPG